MMSALHDLLVRSPPLLLFSVIGLGILVGQVRVRGFRLGVAGVLFTGLAAGAWRAGPDAATLEISHHVTTIGLILFVYGVGISSGPGFFRALGDRALRVNLVVVVALLAAAATALLGGRWAGLGAEQIVGAFCGGLSNTPALAAASELVEALGRGQAKDVAVGYSVAYPFAVLGGLLAFKAYATAMRRRAQREQEQAIREGRVPVPPVNANFEVRNPALFGKAIGELNVQETAGVLISRHRHGDHVSVPTKYSRLEEGDVVLAVGAPRAIDAALAYFGARSEQHLEHESQGPIVMRRILVSKRKLAGGTIEQLHLDRRFNAQVTRVRRADIDFVATPETRLELGDRLRVVMPGEHAAAVAAFFGDSEREIVDVDFTAMTLGISAGVLLGMVSVPVTSTAAVSLGLAGGPLVVALVLGKLGRTGPLTWSLPLETNHALQHVGLLLFLAGVGVNSGERFLTALSHHGLRLWLVGAAVTVVGTATALVGLRLFGKSSVIQSVGATSGMQTQPATLAYANEIFRSDDVYIAYAITYPVAMVGKILLAQLLVVIQQVL